MFACLVKRHNCFKSNDMKSEKMFYAFRLKTKKGASRITFYSSYLCIQVNILDPIAMFCLVKIAVWHIQCIKQKGAKKVYRVLDFSH